jgi:ribosomal protein S27AE
MSPDQKCYMPSKEPLKVEDWVQYENRTVKCGRCGIAFPYAPWPTNSADPVHRPRCANCGSMFTYPISDP